MARRFAKRRSTECTLRRTRGEQGYRRIAAEHGFPWLLKPRARWRWAIRSRALRDAVWAAQGGTDGWIATMFGADDRVASFALRPSPFLEKLSARELSQGCDSCGCDSVLWGLCRECRE